MADYSKEAKFMDEAAYYFEKKDVSGEDINFWANVMNAENCRRIASILRRKSTPNVAFMMVLERNKGTENQFSKAIPMSEGAVDDLRKFLKKGGGWFEYVNAFGEPELLNTNKFDSALIKEYVPGRT